MFDDLKSDRTSDEALDELLAKARWPDVPAGAESRLRAALSAAHDDDVAARGRNIAWRPWLIGGAVAAALVLATVLGSWSRTQRRTKVPPVEEARHVDPGPVPPTVARTPPPAEFKPAHTSRPPNANERLFLIAARRPIRPASPVSRAEPPRPPSQSELRVALLSASATGRADGVRASLRSADSRVLANLSRETACRAWHAALVDELLSRPDPAGTRIFLELVADRSTSALAIGSLRSRPAPPVDRLVGALDDPSVRIRFAAARSLGAVCDRPLLDRLVRMAENGPSRREALAAILCSPTELTQAVLPALSAAPAGREQVKVLRAELASEL